MSHNRNKAALARCVQCFDAVGCYGTHNIWKATQNVSSTDRVFLTLDLNMCKYSRMTHVIIFVNTSHNRAKRLWRHAQFSCETGFVVVATTAYRALETKPRLLCGSHTGCLQAESVRTAAGRGQCVYACQRALESS